MIIIEGKQGKSRKLEEYIKEKVHGSSVIIDYVGVLILGDVTNHYFVEGDNVSPETAIEDFKEHYEEFKQFETVSFYVNASPEMIPKFKKLEEESDHNIIITIQNNELSEVKVYEL
ncbi:hypothetical protein ACU3L3_06990 [Priestia endophytica]